MEQKVGGPVTQLFWPSDISPGTSGYLIGWRFQNTACVATLVTLSWLQSDQLRHVQLELRSSLNLTVELLGHISNPETASTAGPRLSSSATWIDLEFSGKTPRCCSSEQDGMLIVIYKRPSMKRHHFLSLQPLLKSSTVLKNCHQQTKKSNLPAKMRRLNEAYRRPSVNQKLPDITLLHALDLINHSQELHERAYGKYLPAVANQDISQDHSKVESKHTWLIPDSFYACLMLSTTVGLRATKRYGRTSLPRCLTAGPNMSGVLFNTLWLIANDIIFGRSSATLLIENSNLLAVWLESTLEEYTVAFIRKALQWTNSYPAGLKLNDELCETFYTGSVLIVDLWYTYVLKPTFGVLPHIILMTGCISFCGHTFTLAVASDFLALSTFHLWVVYRLFTFVFDWHLRTLQFLFNIFRGRKFNVLRDRTEPATYQLDQLILGTILFTLATFLFPTVLAFYVLLSVPRVLIVVIHAIIDTGLSLLNHFPLFTVMLRLKDPARLPGLSFARNKNLVIRNTFCAFERRPSILSTRDYIALWAELTSHYSPLELLSRLLTGRPIAPLAGPHHYR
ncbi:N-acetylglucosaminyl transferase component-domain-containing protein [Melampsora americana]|nr:N-acetylglucosaminyl transferase component-domain-containing protein [Melampsora americana]